MPEDFICGTPRIYASTHKVPLACTQTYTHAHVRARAYPHVHAHAHTAISMEIMEEPVVAADGHHYEKAMIEHWLAQGKTTSPRTNEPLEHTILIRR